MPKRRIGLYGGTFNPIHAGHTRAAEIVQSRLALDKVLFIPSYIPPHKTSTEIASPSDRLTMIRIALESFPGFIPSSIEIEAREKSYSIITIRKMKKRFPGAEIFFILGSDAWLEIETWKDYDKVLRASRFVVISRPGYSLEQARRIRTSLESSGGLECSIRFLEIDALDVSSTEIRRRIRRGRPVTGLVHPGVEIFIQERRLYKANDERKSR